MMLFIACFIDILLIHASCCLYGNYYITSCVAIGYNAMAVCYWIVEGVVYALSSGHYGIVYSYNNPAWKAVCLSFNPLCATNLIGHGTYPDSRLPTAVCRNLGYYSGYAIHVDNSEPLRRELSDHVLSRDCYAG